MPPGGKIILLHGASSSGKSTLARALQATLSEPFWHISFDHLRDSGVLPSARIASGDFRWKDMRPSFFDGFHRSLAAYARAGNNLIVEHILDTPGWLPDLVRLLEPYDVYFVGVRCSLDELVRRETARGDRPLGSAATDYQTVHSGLVYDLEVDTEKSPSDNLTFVLESWSIRKSPSVFSRLAVSLPSA
jgi:chloramphenicol 3-O phosphotransferase